MVIMDIFSLFALGDRICWSGLKEGSPPKWEGNYKLYLKLCINACIVISLAEHLVLKRINWLLSSQFHSSIFLTFFYGNLKEWLDFFKVETTAVTRKTIPIQSNKVFIIPGKLFQEREFNDSHRMYNFSSILC